MSYRPMAGSNGGGGVGGGGGSGSNGGPLHHVAKGARITITMTSRRESCQCGLRFSRSGEYLLAVEKMDVLVLIFTVITSFDLILSFVRFVLSCI